MRQSGALGRRRILLFLLLVLLATAAVLLYLPVGDNGFVSIDDNIYITDNGQVKSGLTAEGVSWAFTAVGYASNWHPLTWISHMIDVELFGLNPQGHHYMNVFFHAANALLLFALLHAMTGAPLRSAAVAALFALHPLHVESVAWASERKDVLSTLFWMLTTGLYLRYARRPRPGAYALVLVSFTMGLLAKPMLVTLPLTLLLLDFWPLGRLGGAGAPRSREAPAPSPARPLTLLLEKVPLLLLSAASAVITFLAQRRGGAVSELEAISVPARLVNAAVSYAVYLGKMILPRKLTYLYPHPASYGRSIPLWQAGASLLLLLGLTLLVLRLRRRRPYLAAGWAWYLITLLPVIGLIQVGTQSLADRYTYVPLTGIFLALVWWTEGLTRRWPFRKALLAGGLAALFLSYVVLGRAQVDTWRDSATLYRHAVSIVPRNLFAWFNLAHSLEQEGNLTQAKAHYAEVFRIDPKNAKARYAYAAILFKEGRTGEALKQYQLLAMFDPQDHLAPNNIGSVLGLQGRDAEAESYFRKALSIRPDYPEAHINLGSSLQKQGKDGEALEHYREALRLDPGNARLLYNMGNQYAKLGRNGEAIASFRKVLDIDPAYPDVHLNLGAVLERTGDLEASMNHLEAALKQGAKLDMVHYNMARVFTRQGSFEEAVLHYREALRLRPGYPEARAGLERALGGIEGRGP